MRARYTGLLLGVVLVPHLPAAARASVLPTPMLAQMRPLVSIGSPAEDRRRLGQLLGTDSTDGFLLRTASVLSPAHASDARRLRLEVVAPELRLVWNSALPFSLNDGSLWAGRGASVLVRAGVRLSRGPVDLVLDPEFAYAENGRFEVFPGREPGRSTFSSPWHLGPQSADLPLRFGDEAYRFATVGQSAITVAAGGAAFGASTENQWWGPGIRNGLVMSNNGQGIPHFFVRTARPLRTRYGDVEARWVVGGLTESLYFDTLPANDLRSLSGLVVAFRPAGGRDLTVGLARAVYTTVSGGVEAAGRMFDVFTEWHGPPQSDQADSSATSDQILSLFARWLFPASRFEVYGEWSRIELPRSLRELLTAPHHTQGYTIGLQWARPVGGRDAVFRLQSEVTNLEQTIVFRDRPPADYYTGRATSQGYTQRGEVIGAAIGPGASSQWLAGDYLARRWQVGAFVGRIRWENDALYRQPVANFFRHDVSVFAGLRAGARLPHLEVTTEFTAARRNNYLFQNGFANPRGRRTIDVVNYTLALLLSPR